MDKKVKDRLNKLDKLLDLVTFHEMNLKECKVKVTKDEEKKYVLSKMLGENRCIICDIELNPNKYFTSVLFCESCIDNMSIDELLERYKVVIHE